MSRKNHRIRLKTVNLKKTWVASLASDWHLETWILGGFQFFLDRYEYD